MANIYNGLLHNTVGSNIDHRFDKSKFTAFFFLFFKWAKYSSISPSTSSWSSRTNWVIWNFCFFSTSCYAIFISLNFVSCSIQAFSISTWATIFAFSISTHAEDIFATPPGWFCKVSSPQILMSTLYSVIYLFSPDLLMNLLTSNSNFLLLSFHSFVIWSIYQVSVP